MIPLNTTLHIQPFFSLSIPYPLLDHLTTLPILLYTWPTWYFLVLTKTNEDNVEFIGEDYTVELTDGGEGHSSSFLDVGLVRIFIGNRVSESLWISTSKSKWNQGYKRVVHVDVASEVNGRVESDPLIKLAWNESQYKLWKCQYGWRTHQSGAVQGLDFSWGTRYDQWAQRALRQAIGKLRAMLHSAEEQVRSLKTKGRAHSWVN